MTEVAGPLQGVPVLDARAKAIELLEASGRLVQAVERDQDIPVSERGKILLKSSCSKSGTFVKHTSKTACGSTLNPSPSPGSKPSVPLGLDGQHQHRLAHQRRRWYHTEIPIWYSEDQSKVVVPPAGTYVQPWKDQPPAGSRVLDRESREDLGAFEDVKGTLGTIVGEEKVFDTWMDSSSNSNLFVSGFLNHPEVFKEAFPTALRPQGKEIVRTWLYYTLLKSTLVLDQPGFQHVWIDGLGMDPWGRKMSKSLGNGIDADSVLECGAGGRTGSWQVKGPDGSVKLRANKIGSECFRLWKACDAQVGDDFHINPEEIEKKYFGVLTKLFNVARFASQFDVPEDLDTPPEHLAPEDRWVLAEFQQTMSQVEAAWTNLDIYTATQVLKPLARVFFRATILRW